jgi:hypothetical protein
MKKVLYAVMISLFAFGFIFAQEKATAPDKPPKEEKVGAVKGCCGEMKEKDCSGMKADKGCCDAMGQKGSKQAKQMKSSSKKAEKTN